MSIVLVVITLLVTVPLVAAAVLVSVASRQEESARSLAGHPPGPVAGLARQLLGFRAIGISQPSTRGYRPTRWSARPPTGTRPMLVTRLTADTDVRDQPRRLASRPSDARPRSYAEL